MTQHQLIIAYIEEYGSMLPAKLYGEIYRGVMFGSETSKRCRELRAYTLPSVKKYPRLESDGEGKFERFWLATNSPRAKVIVPEVLKRFENIPVFREKVEEKTASRLF